MPFNPYPLPAQGAGSQRRVPVEGTNQAILFSHLHDRALHSDGISVAVTLLPDPRAQGFKVKWDYGIIGTLPAEFKSAYPQLERVTGSQQTPEVTALVEVDAQRGGVNVNVLLPEPQWVAPVNDPPEGLWTLLPGGAAMAVDLSVGVDVPADELATLYQAQLLVELTLVNERVTVTYRDRVLGVLGPQDSTALAEAIQHFEQLGLRCVARAFLDGGVVTVECARTEQLAEADLEPEVSPLPALTVPAFEEPEPEDTGITEAADGSWSIQVPSESFEAITPEKLAEHNRARRRVSSPVMPERPAPRTEIIPVVDLPEDEPVQGIRPGGPALQRARLAAEPEHDPEPPSGTRWWVWLLIIAAVIIVVGLVGLLLSGGSV